MQALLVEQACANSLLDLKAARAVQNGCIQHWDAVGKLWEHMFLDLMSINPAEEKILLTESPSTSKGYRQRLFETLFEQFGFSAVSTQVQAALTLYAQGAPCDS